MKETEHVGFQIKILSNLLKRKISAFAQMSEDDDFTEMQRQIIDFLYERRKEADTFQRDVEERFSIRRSTASRILQRLEEKEIISREAVSCDARLKKLVLTPKALEKHESIKSKIEELETLVVKGLTKEEIRVFLEIAQKIKSNIE